MKQQQKPKTKSRSQRLLGLLRLAVIGVLAVSIVLVMTRQPITQRQPVEFPHIHGLGFSSDGTQLFVPAHIGLIVFAGNAWSMPELPKHDYMGYSVVDTGFYSSGHPDLRTDFPPLLGLVKSEDAGRSIQPLAFEGESDFHLMGASYYSHTVYVINPEHNSGIGTGLFYTTDDGLTWVQSSAQGLGGNPIQIAVHPTEPGTIALATEAGIFLSNDYGDTFIRLGDTQPITAATFHPDGTTLFFGYQSVFAYGLAAGDTQALDAPPTTGQNALQYIAVNPDSGELALATSNRDIYLSQNNRQTWQQIVRQGVG